MVDYSQLSTRDKFIVSRWAYSVGNPIISDAEYTSLLNAMTATAPNDEYVLRSWSSDPCPTELLKSIGRDDLIQSIILADKTESIPSLNTDLEVKRELGNVTKPGTLSMKHDGWNIQANYYNGSLVNVMTRGRSSDAVDVSKLQSRFPNTIPSNNKIKIVCELTISKENYKFCASMFGNVSERSAVSTVLARPEYHYLLSFHAFDIHGYTIPEDKNKFEVLSEWGFETPDWYRVTDYNSILIALQELSDKKEGYGSPTDGAVYDGELRRAIRLLAWEEPIYKSYVTGYLEQYGPYRISPSVLIKPILRGGTTQRRLSMTNWQRIFDYNLRPGAPLAFRIASSATADFDEEATKLLQQEYEGRWDVFAKIVDENEEISKCKRQLYLQS